MRLFSFAPTRVITAHVLAFAVTLLAGCPAPAQPTYADITYQTRCNTRTGGPIMGCTEPTARSIFGFSGDMGTRFSCTISEHGGIRNVNFSVTANDPGPSRTPIGVALRGASVASAGGAPSACTEFTWIDGNTYGGACGPTAPTAAQPCQVSRIDFVTDMATGLPRMDVAVLCTEAPSIPAATPAITRSVSRDGVTDPMRPMPFTIHLYSCPVLR